MNLSRCHDFNGLGTVGARSEGDRRHYLTLPSFRPCESAHSRAFNRSHINQACGLLRMLSFGRPRNSWSYDLPARKMVDDGSEKLAEAQRAAAEAAEAAEEGPSCGTVEWAWQAGLLRLNFCRSVNSQHPSGDPSSSYGKLLLLMLGLAGGKFLR